MNVTGQFSVTYLLGERWVMGAHVRTSGQSSWVEDGWKAAIPIWAAPDLAVRMCLPEMQVAGLSFSL